MASQYIGWLSCVFCLVFTIRCALTFGKESINIFLALVIYAAQWGVLIVYYSTLLGDRDETVCKHLPEFLPAISGYLCAVVGSIIHRDQNATIGKHAIFRERFIAFLLLFIVLPEGIELLNLHSYHINHEDIEVVVTLVLKFFGFQSLYLAANVSTTSKIRLFLISSCLITYWSLEAAYTSIWLYNKHWLHVEGSVMNDFFLCGFSTVKVVTTIIFIPTILSHCDHYKKMETKDKLKHFFHLDSFRDN